MAKQGLQAGDEIGQSGIESAFNSYLQGIDGSARVRVDSFGRRRSQRTLVTPAQPGQTVRLTLDTGLELAAQNALAYGIQLAHNNHQWAADGGAIVAMDPQTGAILAAASSPTYDPAVYTGRVTRARSWRRRASRRRPRLAHNYPALDRALDAEYPPGSIFKPLTAIAALQEGIVNPYALEPCTRHVRRARGPLAPRLAQLGPDRRPGDDAADGDRALVRHVLLPPRQHLLSPAARPRPARADVGAQVRLRPADADRDRPAGDAASCRRSRGSTARTRARRTRTAGGSTASGSRATRSSSRSDRETSP